MSAKPARTITEVRSYVNDEGQPRCVVTLEGGQKVGLHDLSRAEVLRAAKIAFPQVSGKAWFKLDTKSVTDAIRTNKAPEGLAAVGESTKAPPKATKATESTTEAPKAKDEPKVPETTEDRRLRDLADAIAALTPEPTPAVDEDQVKAIVADAVDKALTEAHVVKVEIKGFKSVKLPEQSHRILPELVQVLAAECHAFLVGPAGSGKSTLAHQAAQATTTEYHPDGLPFGALSVGPTTPTTKVFGYCDANGNYVRTPFRDIYEGGGVFCLDELDNGHPGLVAELNQALANGYGAFADGIVKAHPDFRVVATGNTFGKGPDRLFVGRNILDAATLDRFVTIEVLVDEDLERSLALGYATESTLDKVRKYVALVQSVRKSVLDAGLPLVVSPRASIQGAKLIAQGLDPKRVAEIRLYAGWSEENRRKAGV